MRRSMNRQRRRRAVKADGCTVHFCQQRKSDDRKKIEEDAEYKMCLKANQEVLEALKMSRGKCFNEMISGLNSKENSFATELDTRWQFAKMQLFQSTLVRS